MEFAIALMTGMNLPPHIIDAANLAVRLAESSLRLHAQDLPVGAVALVGKWVRGTGVASDNRLNIPYMHAEMYALTSASLQGSSPISEPVVDTLVSTMEPCKQCQTNIPAYAPLLQTVYYLLDREDFERIGLVRQYSQKERLALPKTKYNSVRLELPELKQKALDLLSRVRRDHSTGEITITGSF